MTVADATTRASGIDARNPTTWCQLKSRALPLAERLSVRRGRIYFQPHRRGIHRYTLSTRNKKTRLLHPVIAPSTCSRLSRDVEPAIQSDHDSKKRAHPGRIFPSMPRCRGGQEERAPAAKRNRHRGSRVEYTTTEATVAAGSHPRRRLVTPTATLRASRYRSIAPVRSAVPNRRHRRRHHHHRSGC